MLKALELVGFKSFATKTRFDFHDGITAVVGPNGSGKSNVVDAIKWVLGEQSVKSLRGKEMTDVIFNGSGSRKAVNSAEVTLTFDNSESFFKIEAPELQITRRVYRSGESEYLINRQPCRLRDIRDLLSDTGLGAQAYSIIEQGKVDALLQSSPKDRRLIFEEAAGISRFRTKKLEALRRLDRVEQNLLRLSDIVDEVEHRLRSVKMQAGKARRYREYVNRLQELRTQVGLVDWQRLGEQLQQLEAEAKQIAGQRDAATAEAAEMEERYEQIDVRVEESEDRVRAIESKIASIGESIAADRSTIIHERKRCNDIETEIARHRRQLAAMNVRAGDLRQQMHDTSKAAKEAGDKHHEIRQRFDDGEKRLQAVVAHIERVRNENKQMRAGLMERMKDASSFTNQISVCENRIDANDAAILKLRERIGDIDRQVQAADQLRLQCEETQTALRQEEQHERQQVETAKQRLAEQQDELAASQERLSRLQQRRSGLVERADVLEQLQSRHEGLSPGVKDVLLQMRNEPKGPFGLVHGVVADLLRVSVESAPLIEIALGEKAQHLVAPPEARLVKHIESVSVRLPGRVGFVWLDRNGADNTASYGVDFEGRPGVLGRADRFVETDPAYAQLAKRLLGRTWIVESLSGALALSRNGQGITSFVTVAGEFMAPDGTLIVGPRHAASGLISRRSELRAIQSQLEQIGDQIDDTRMQVKRLRQHIAATQEQVEHATDGHRQALRALDQHQHKLESAEEKTQQLLAQKDVAQTELAHLDTEKTTAEESLSDNRRKLAEAEESVQELEDQLAEHAKRLAQLETDRQTQARETTDVKIELAKSEERLEYLHSRLRQFQENRQERQKSIEDHRRRLAECEEKHAESERHMLAAGGALALLFLEKERLVAEARELLAQRDGVATERAELRTAMRERQTKAQKLETRLHKNELSAAELQLQRKTMAERLKEDYGIELADLEAQAAEELDEESQREREEVQHEIDDLRRKVNNLGNVNLDALNELESLEERYTTLAGQYKDLVDAKTSLERIIERINVDSRRLFLDTFERIKEHFERLFRDLFGGGQANLVMDEDADILDGGVEIIARPPGKEPRNISLLSGGEKTLTCVALLLAVFHNRPSPFCVLDEVDAALDEANISRFMNVLLQFLDMTQFVIITHSKKTMAAANTIYGVTMQESGVSKQVSVEFEDVSDNGELASDGDGPTPQAA